MTPKTQNFQRFTGDRLQKFNLTKILEERKLKNKQEGNKVPDSNTSSAINLKSPTFNKAKDAPTQEINPKLNQELTKIFDFELKDKNHKEDSTNLPSLTQTKTDTLGKILNRKEASKDRSSSKFQNSQSPKMRITELRKEESLESNPLPDGSNSPLKKSRKRKVTRDTKKKLSKRSLRSKHSKAAKSSKFTSINSLSKRSSKMSLSQNRTIKRKNTITNIINLFQPRFSLSNASSNSRHSKNSLGVSPTSSDPSKLHSSQDHRPIRKSRFGQNMMDGNNFRASGIRSPKRKMNTSVPIHLQGNLFNKGINGNQLEEIEESNSSVDKDILESNSDQEIEFLNKKGLLISRVAALLTSPSMKNEGSEQSSKKKKRKKTDIKKSFNPQELSYLKSGLKSKQPNQMKHQRHKLTGFGDPSLARTRKYYRSYSQQRGKRKKTDFSPNELLNLDSSKNEERMRMRVYTRSYKQRSKYFSYFESSSSNLLHRYKQSSPSKLNSKAKFHSFDKGRLKHKQVSNKNQMKIKNKANFQSNTKQKQDSNGKLAFLKLKSSSILKGLEKLKGKYKPLFI